ncbi:hypothetical protein F444_06010 [Phytophthora nicotianae P1976]|uniref:Uncharacterized protein n=1 Tax=Phytophthora nicotianae P1976 TaxID=1317066 RepID=A0A081AK60_PHYNI|nr:hypothetical protein F444_06010 [Phytophthora nicotianae P1976]
MRPAQLAGLGHEQAAVGRQAGEHRLFEGEATHEASHGGLGNAETPADDRQGQDGWSMLKTKMAVTGPVAERNYTMGLNAQPSSA